MDLKEPGNLLYIVGVTRDELGGSHFELAWQELATGPTRNVPQLDPHVAKQTFAAIHRAIHAGLVRACHDLSEGGLAVAVAEMAFAGGLGAYLDLADMPFESNDHLGWPREVLLFSESNTRFLCEVRPENAADFERALGDVAMRESAKLRTP